MPWRDTFPFLLINSELIAHIFILHYKQKPLPPIQNILQGLNYIEWHESLFKTILQANTFAGILALRRRDEISGPWAWLEKGKKPQPFNAQCHLNTFRVHCVHSRMYKMFWVKGGWRRESTHNLKLKMPKSILAVHLLYSESLPPAF